MSYLEKQDNKVEVIDEGTDESDDKLFEEKNEMEVSSVPARKSKNSVELGKETIVLGFYIFFERGLGLVNSRVDSDNSHETEVENKYKANVG